MTKSQREVICEALASYRAQWAWWLKLKVTTENERELASTKIALIDEAVAELREIQ